MKTSDQRLGMFGEEKGGRATGVILKE